jgi:cytochrome P450
MSAKLPPSPSYSRPVAMFRWVSDMPGVIEGGRQLGDVWTFQLMGGVRFVFVSDPKLIEEVFRATDLHHAESAIAAIFGPNSLIMTNDEEHVAKRRLLQPPFQAERVQRYRDTMARICQQEISAWPLRHEFPALPRLNAVGLGVILEVLFGATGGEREAPLRANFESLLTMADSGWRVFYNQLKSARGMKPPGWLLRALRSVDASIGEEIAQARADPQLDQREDVLAELVRARHEDGTEISDAEIRDHLMTLVFQGHRSTVHALGWALERVTRQPEVLEQLQAEAQTSSEKYLDAVVKETLRVRPPFPFVNRTVREPSPIGEYEVPAGTVIALNTYILHRRGDIYPEPDRFRPGRFIDHEPGAYEWIPFGAGGRACIGAGFALLEMKTVLHTIFEQLRLAPTDRPDEKIKRVGVGFAPKDGARITIQERIFGVQPATDAARSTA